MSVLINQQDETVNNIEAVAGRVEDDTGRGYAPTSSFLVCASHSHIFLFLA